MKHFDNFCKALGFILLLAGVIVCAGYLFGIRVTWPCVYTTYASFSTTEVPARCEL